MRQVTQQTTETFGYRTLLGADGAEGVAIYAARRSDIAAVLTDMMMPVMDGLAMIRVLRTLNPRAPIIAASGHSTNNHVVGATHLGVKHFLPKPYTAEALLGMLRRALETVS